MQGKKSPISISIAKLLLERHKILKTFPIAFDFSHDSNAFRSIGIHKWTNLFPVDIILCEKNDAKIRENSYLAC